MSKRHQDLQAALEAGGGGGQAGGKVLMCKSLMNLSKRHQGLQAKHEAMATKGNVSMCISPIILKETGPVNSFREMCWRPARQR